MVTNEAQGMWIGADGSASRVRVKSGALFEAFHGIGDGLRRSGRDLGASAADYARAYTSAVWAYRCVKVRSDALAGVPLMLVDRGGERIEQHPILDLLRDVNPHTMNLGDLLRATEAAYNIWGVAYWLKVTAGSANGNGRNPHRVKSLVWLNPQTVEPITDAERGVVGYKQTIGGKTRVFAPEDVIVFRNFDPLDDLGGLSPLGVALSEINAELNAARFVAAFFANDARPAGLLTTDQPMMDAEVERTRTWWQKLFQGTDNKWKTGIVGGGLKWQTITFPPTDLALGDLRAEDRRAICAVFGVPAGMAGAWEATTYATAREQKASFYEDTLIPQMEYLAEVLNWSLLRPHYPDLAARGARLAFDFDSITALRESATDKADRLTRLYQAGVITLNEVRAGLGMPLVEEVAAPAAEERASTRDAPTEGDDPQGGGSADQDAAGYVGAQHAAPLHNGNGHGKKTLQAELDRWERVAPASSRVVQQELDRWERVAPASSRVVQQELDRWERFALKRMKAKRPIRAFRSAAIPPDIWWRIATALNGAANIDEVRGIFDAAMSNQHTAASEAVAAGAD